MATIGREAARAPLTSADINDGIVTAADLASTLDLSSKSVTLPTLATVDINGGNIDGTIIGAATPAAGSFTTVTASDDVNFDSGTFFVDASANAVGIGTTSPSQPLTIEAAAGYLVTAQENSANKVRFQAYADGTQVALVSGYDTTAKPMTFFTGAAERMRIDSSGNVGIGRASSSVVRLSVAGTDATSSNYAFEATNNSFATRFIVRNDGQSQFFKSDNSASMTITSAGNVGIGTSSPTQKLHLVGSGDTMMLVNDGTYNSFFGTISGQTRVSNDNTIPIVFATNSTERMRIDSSGNVGIATSDPKSTLEVKGTFGAPATSGFASGFIARFSQSSGVGSLDFGFGDPYSWIQSRASNNYATNFDLALNPNGGNVGIGTSSPTNPLHIYVDTASSQAFTTSGNGGAIFLESNSSPSNGGYGSAINFTRLAGTRRKAAIVSKQTGSDGENVGLAFFTANGDYGSNSNVGEVMLLTGAGNLLVGTTSGSDRLNVYQAAGGTICTLESAGTAAAYALQFKNPNGTVGNVTISGTTTTYNISSDARLKENIADAESSSELIDAIQVRQFDWKADGSHQRYGMVAQELLEVAPEAVSGDPESEDMMGVDYSKLVPMLVKEIQSLRARVAQLEGA